MSVETDEMLRVFREACRDAASRAWPSAHTVEIVENVLKLLGATDALMKELRKRGFQTRLEYGVQMPKTSAYRMKDSQKKL